MVRKFTKRALLLFITLVLCLSSITIFSGCRNNNPEIVVTIFPAYDWTRVIIGSNPNNFRVRYLMENGVDPHFFSPSIRDTADIINSQLFIYIGEAEFNVVPILRQHPRVNRLSMMDLVETKEREFYWDDDHECDDDCFHGEIHDEHVWLSLKMARVIVTHIAEEIALLDPENAAYYLQNAKSYNQLLLELDLEFAQMAENSPRDTVLFADRFPFLYLMYDYSINWIAATDGCSSQTNISATRRIQLENYVRQHNIAVVLILEDEIRRPLAQQIVANTPASQVRVLNSIQTVNRRVANQNNITYLSMMRDNLEALREALA